MNKQITTLLLGMSVVATAQALTFTTAAEGALFGEATRPVHNTALNSGMNLNSDMTIQAQISHSRAEAAQWEITAPIYDLPEGGEYKLYRRTNEMIYYTFNGLVMATDDYFAGEVVFYENGDVYLRNMIPSMLSGSYLKGTYADNKITLQFPQGLCYDDPHYDDDGNYVTDSVWPVFRGDYEIKQVWDEEYEDYVGTIDVWVDPDCQTVTFTINEDGSITQDEGGLIGVFTQGEIWYGEAAWEYKYEPFEEEAQSIPEGLEAEDWAFFTEYDAFMTKVAIDGNDIYWKGMYRYLPNSAVKGTIDGDKVYFASPSYLGVDPTSYHLAYFAGAESINNWLSIVKKPAFKYDSEKKEITYPRKYVVINAGPSKINLLADYSSPTLHYQAADADLTTPKTPIIQWVSEFEYEPIADMNCWFTVVDIPNVDVNGNLMDRDRMWYNFYFDDELFWFDMDDYGLVADSPDVPYTYDDNFNIYFRGNFQHYVYFYWTGFKTMGVQSVFESEDGNIYKSEMAVYVNPNGGIGGVDTDAQILNVTYYDLQGRMVTNPEGLCLKRTLYADGKVDTKKIVIKK